MSRSSFGFWGAELNDEDFAKALAALGVLWGTRKFAGSLPPNMNLKEVKRELASAIASARKGDEVLPWTFDEKPSELASYQTSPDAGLLSRAWTKAVPTNRPPKLRLEIQPDTWGKSILPWIVEQLSHEAVGAKSVYERIEPRRALVQWNWPLRVGVLDEADARQLENALHQHHWGSRLCSVETVGISAWSSDVLILPSSLRQGLGELLQRAPQARASCTMLLGGLDEPWERAQPLVEALLSQTNASCVCISPVPVENWATRFTDILFELSHDQALDVAWYAAQRRTGGQAPLLFASRPLIIRTRVSVIAGDLFQHLRHLPQGTHVPIPGKALGYPPHRDVVRGSMSAQELADMVEGKLQAIGYFHEEHGASYIAAVNKQIQQPAPPLLGTPRWIQGQAYELRGEGGPQRVERALRAGARHMLVVRIGPADKEWLTPPQEAVFPDHKLEWDVDQHELRVVFSEPNHIPQPQTATITLPRTGASTTCQFLFQTRTDVPTFQGRVIVLHRNRVLQTALLEGRVVPDPVEAPDGPPLRLHIEGLIRPILEGLNARQDFGLALVANHTPEGSPAVTAISEEWVAFRPMKDIDDKRRRIVSLLTKLAKNPDDYPKDLRHQNNVDLLWSLAFLGNALYRGIVPSQINPDRLKDIPRIQLVSASHEYLPLEFFYDLPAPKIGAKLCPGAEKALEEGKWSEKTLKEGKCPECTELKEQPGGGADVICPFGFWCMRMIIERHAVRADHRTELQGAPFALRSSPMPGADELKILHGALLAASEKADAMRPGTTQQVLSKLQSATSQHAVQVNTWEDWLDAVRKDPQPSLLVLLTHTSKAHLAGGKWPQLEIGKKQTLVEAYITPQPGQASQYLLPSPDAKPPVVFLLGCTTLAPDVGVGDFTVAFQDGGAAIVLSTLTPVLGRDVGPVAEALIEHLQETVKKEAPAKDRTFGYAMRALRCQALVQGNLMILCLVSHGDADWRLAPV
jgi:hypothetical protein